MDDGVLAGRGSKRRRVGLDLFVLDLAVIEIGDLQRDPGLHGRRYHTQADMREDRHVQHAEEHWDVLRVGDRVEQHELGDAPIEAFALIEGQYKRDTAAEGVTDYR